MFKALPILILSVLYNLYVEGTSILRTVSSIQRFPLVLAINVLWYCSIDNGRCLGWRPTIEAPYSWLSYNEVRPLKYYIYLIFDLRLKRDS